MNHRHFTQPSIGAQPAFIGDVLAARRLADISKPLADTRNLLDEGRA